uniref:Uncharacterized protein n=1 Tax=Gasterosteus aculeatus TaxID=69293 RepID=G3NS46_GASAC
HPSTKSQHQSKVHWVQIPTGTILFTISVKRPDANSSVQLPPPLVFQVYFSCDCFQTSMPLKWSCGSTVFALAVHPSRVQTVTALTSVPREGFHLRLVLFHHTRFFSF